MRGLKPHSRIGGRPLFRNLANRIFGDIMLIFNREEEHARNRLYLLRFSIYTNVIAILFGGYFFTGLLLKLGADDAYMGAVTIVTYACSFAAVFSPMLVDRFMRRKTMLLLSRGLYYLLLLGFITAMPYLNAGASAKLSGILVLVALANLIAALAGNGFSAWHLQSLPESIRSSFYANLSMIIGVLNMILLNLAALFADFFKAKGQEVLGIVLLRLLALLIAFAEIYSLSRIREYPYERPEKRASLREIFAKPLENRRYRAVMAVIMLWMLASTIPGPFFQVYLLRDLHISYSFLSIVNLLNIPVLVIAMPLWGRAVSRMGDAGLFPPLTALLSLHFLSLAFVTEANYQWLYPISVFYFFVIAAGIAQAASMMPFKYIPEASHSNYLPFYGAVTALSALGGTLIGQGFVLSTESAGIVVQGIPMGNKQLLMLATGAAVLLGAVLMAFINRWLAKTNKKMEEKQG
jgi:MFS family permease